MIIRNKTRKTFTVISNQAINDTQLSDKALGTLVRLLSKTDDWNLNVNYMVNTGKQGRTAIRSSIAELEKAGYIHKQSGRTKSGQITRPEYLVYEDAVAREQAPATTPEQHQQPMVKALVNQAVKKYTALEMEEAIVYSSANVKGGWMQYKAYLDKTLKNKWAAGYLEAISTTSPAVLSPGRFAGGMPGARFPNGTVTGSAWTEWSGLTQSSGRRSRQGRCWTTCIVLEVRLPPLLMILLPNT